MKGDSSNTSTDRCKVHRTRGKSFSVFIPITLKESKAPTNNATIKALAKQFDFIQVAKAEHCFKPERAEIARCKRGLEATVIRKANYHGSDQEQADREAILEIAHAHVGKFDTPILLGVDDGIIIYSVDCKKKA